VNRCDITWRYDVSVASDGSADSRNQLTIEQLAAQSGMTVRNIRSHQARGLLSPPEVRARVGYYGPDHLAQLKMIRELQGEGFNLGGIKRLMDDGQGTADRLRRFKAALTGLPEEPAETLSIAQLGRRFRTSAEDAPAVLARAERLGVLVPAGEAVYQVPSPSLLAVAEEAIGRGVPLGAAFDLFEQLERHCDAAARAFTELFVAQVWRTLAAAEPPADRWPELDEALERLLPLSSGALQAIFQRRMHAQVRAAIERLPDELETESAA
jgi:DNA-binding transcriptional MerR regulator